MRTPTYLSPSAILKFHDNLDEYYIKYLSEIKIPDFPQTQPMGCGSSFDAFVKSYLHEALIGKDPRFDLKTLFEAQVQPHNRDYCWEAGKHCFDQYQKCGALSDLMLELQKAIGTPRFEIEIKGVINGFREGVTLTKEGVIFLGKPDVFFINSAGAHVILDWKVNGYGSKWGASPMQGYVNIRNDPHKSGAHADAMVQEFKGIKVNMMSYLDYLNPDWAAQLSIYGWLCGEEIGEPFIVGIDQLAVKNSHIRVAQHRLRVSREFQWKVFANAQKIWETVHSDWIFRDRSRQESLDHCALLDAQASMLLNAKSEGDEWFNQITRS